MPVTGSEVRLARLFDDADRVVIVAVDHGLYFGPLPGMINLPEAIKTIANADGILMGPGMPAFCKDVFNQLPMEFAVEADRLLSLKLEGSVG